MFKNLDVIGGIAGCLGGAAVILLGYVSREQATSEIGLAVLVASIVYLSFRKRIVNSANPFLPESKALTFSLSVIFFAAYSASLLVMHESVHRPPLYFALTSVAVAAVAAEMLAANGKTQAGLILFKILLIGFSLRYGLLYDFPGFHGVDPWTHAVWIEDWVRNGHLSFATSIGTSSYASYPGMHLNVMAVRIITLASPRDSLFLSIGLPYLFSIIFIFLLGQRLVNTRAGLLAALFISVDMHHILWGAWLVPTSLGIAVLGITLWLIYKGGTNLSYGTVLASMMFLLIIFAHTLSSLVIAVTLALLFVASEAYGRLSRVSVEKTRLGINVVMLFWVGMLSAWMYFSYTPGRQFFVDVLTWFTDTVKNDVEYTGAAFTAATESAIPVIPLNRVGFLMLIFLIVLGSLYWLSRKAIDNRKVAIIVGALGLSFVTFVTPILSIKNLIPGRWLPFISVLAAPIVAEGILAASRVINGNVKKSILMALLVLTFAVFMINTQGVNIYTPFYGKDYAADPQRHAFTMAELSAVDTIPALYDGAIVTDSPYGALPFENRIGRGRVRVIGETGVGLVIIRKYASTHPEIVGISDEVRAGVLNDITSSNYNAVYDNGEVKAYLATP